MHKHYTLDKEKVLVELLTVSLNESPAGLTHTLYLFNRPTKTIFPFRITDLEFQSICDAKNSTFNIVKSLGLYVSELNIQINKDGFVFADLCFKAKKKKIEIPIDFITGLCFSIQTNTQIFVSGKAIKECGVIVTAKVLNLV